MTLSSSKQKQKKTKLNEWTFFSNERKTNERTKKKACWHEMNVICCRLFSRWIMQIIQRNMRIETTMWSGLELYILSVICMRTFCLCIFRLLFNFYFLFTHYRSKIPAKHSPSSCGFVRYYFFLYNVGGTSLSYTSMCFDDERSSRRYDLRKYGLFYHRTSIWAHMHFLLNVTSKFYKRLELGRNIFLCYKYGQWPNLIEMTI